MAILTATDTPEATAVVTVVATEEAVVVVTAAEATVVVMAVVTAAAAVMAMVIVWPTWAPAFKTKSLVSYSPFCTDCSVTVN